MFDTEITREKHVDRALVVGVYPSGDNVAAAREHLAELAELAGNLGVEVVATMLTPLKSAQAHYFVGSGKAAEIEEKFRENNCDILVFDAEFTPSQQRNWEKLVNAPVIERREVILDIFAERAITREARLQVELARLEYALPRLTGAWGHLSRQRGGAKGTRGEGEKQIENDRRMVQRKIASLKTELEAVKKQRATMRKSRQKSPIPKAAIVGYTNVGKSSLLNALGQTEVLAEDKLFATLDPSTRRVRPDANSRLLLTDTVGFVRKLPHTLVAAFKSTLEEAAYADFLITVLDVSSDFIEEHWETTMAVLSELGAADKEMIVVFNKCDLPHDKTLEARARGIFPDGIFVSVRTGLGMEKLKSELATVAKRYRKLLRVELPPERSDLAALAHAQGEVFEEEYGETGAIKMVLSIDRGLEGRYASYALPEKQQSSSGEVAQ